MRLAVLLFVLSFWHSQHAGESVKLVGLQQMPLQSSIRHLLIHSNWSITTQHKYGMVFCYHAQQNVIQVKSNMRQQVQHCWSRLESHCVCSACPILSSWISIFTCSVNLTLSFWTPPPPPVLCAGSHAGILSSSSSGAGCLFQDLAFGLWWCTTRPVMCYALPDQLLCVLLLHPPGFWSEGLL